MVKIRYLKIGMLLECAVLAFLGIFYFSCGEALYMRESDGCVAEFPATGEIGELTDGILAERRWIGWMRLVFWYLIMEGRKTAACLCVWKTLWTGV